MMSDSYLGMDQQYDICLEVLPPSIEAQVNTELIGDQDDLDLDLDMANGVLAPPQGS